MGTMTAGFTRCQKSVYQKISPSNNNKVYFISFFEMFSSRRANTNIHESISAISTQCMSECQELFPFPQCLPITQHNTTLLRLCVLPSPKSFKDRNKSSQLSITNIKQNI